MFDGLFLSCFPVFCHLVFFILSYSAMDLVLVSVINKELN